MAWLTNFLLGRPGYEFSFDPNPDGMKIDEMPIAILQRNLAGDLKKSVLRASAPLIKINSAYLPIDQRNTLASMAMISDTFLSFQTRDDWQVVAQKIIPTSLTQVILPKSSATQLSTILVAGGFSSVITINSVSTIPNPTAGGTYGSGGFGSGGYAGPDYFAGGSYDDASRTITLGSALPSLNPVYATYTYKGWLVNMEMFSHSITGGRVDNFIYDFQLTGA